MDFPKNYSIQDDDASEKVPLSPTSSTDDSDLGLLESQLNEKDEVPIAAQSSQAAEYSISTSAKFTALGGYFAANLILTLYNKVVLGSFPYPILLTVIHSTCSALGCAWLWSAGYIPITPLQLRENLILVAFSALYFSNIAVSNISLERVSVPFHQIVRATCPVFTVLIYAASGLRTYSRETYLSLIPVVFGVAMATFGDVHFEVLGFLLTVLGVILAAVKTVASNRLMTGSLALPPLEVLLRMTPLAACQGLIYAISVGEVSAVMQDFSVGKLDYMTLILLVGNGALAFVLNVSSFHTNKLAGALTLTVAANVKQCLTILLGTLLFHVTVTALNAWGMLIALAGAAFYSKVELAKKSHR